MNEHLSLGSSQARFLEELSEDAFWNYAHEMAHTVSNSLPASDEYLHCELASGRYLLSLTLLHEIVPAPGHYTLLPMSPPWMYGLTAWHNEVIAVIDLDAYLCGTCRTCGTKEVMPTDADGVLLITQEESADRAFTFGLHVPAIGATMTIDGAHIVPLHPQSALSTSEAHALPPPEPEENSVEPAGDTAQNAACPPSDARELLVGSYAGAWVLDMQTISTNIVQQIEMLAHE